MCMEDQSQSHVSQASLQTLCRWCKYIKQSGTTINNIYDVPISILILEVDDKFFFVFGLINFHFLPDSDPFTSSHSHPLCTTHVGIPPPRMQTGNFDTLTISLQFMSPVRGPIQSQMAGINLKIITSTPCVHDAYNYESNSLM